MGRLQTILLLLVIQVVRVLGLVVHGGENEPVDLLLMSYRSHLGECSEQYCVEDQKELTIDNAYLADMASTRIQRSSFVTLLFASVG